MPQFLQIDSLTFGIDSIEWWHEFKDQFTYQKKLRIKLKDGSDILLEDEDRIKKFKSVVDQSVTVI